jgi:GNAT superfamily N-acetyltransferase
MILGISGDPRKRAKVQTPALRVRMARPADAAWLKPQWREWVGEYDNVMDALDAGELSKSNVLALSLEMARTGRVCGGLIAAPPNRYIRKYLPDPAQAHKAVSQVVKLEAVGVDPAYRRQGGGSLLIREAIGRFSRGSSRWMYGQFDTSRQLTNFYSQLGFTVHPPGQRMRGPEYLGLGYFRLEGIPTDQWFEQIL